MDYIFGQSDKQEEKGKRKEKQLKTEIFVPEKDPNHKQLTPLQRFKLEAKKKLQEKHQQEPENEFQQVQQPTPEQKSEIKQTESPKSPKKSQSSRLMSPKKVESPRKAMSPVKTKEEAQSKPVKTNSPLKQLKQAQLKVDIRSAKEIKQPMKSDSIELKRSKSIKEIKENKGIKEVARISKPIKAIKEVKKPRPPKLQIEPDYGYEFKIEPQPDVRDLLEIQLGQSERGLKFLEKKFIGDKIGDAQNLVYNAETSQKPKEYLKNAYSNIQPDNEFIKEGVDETVNNALKSINKLIQHPKEKQFSIQKRRAPRHKDDLKELQKLDKVRLIKIKQGQVKHKVGDLRSQLQKEYFMNKHMLNLNPQDIMDANYYSMQHPETQKAQNLIRQINKKRRMQQRHFREMLSHQEAEKERIHQIEKEYEEKLNRERKEKLREFYEQKHLEREEQKEELKKKEEEFKSWIKMYEKEKPLEEKLEEEMVMKFIIPQIQDRHRKLVKIKAEHRPIDIQEINEHDQRYMQLKRDEKIRQKAQLQSKMQNDLINEQQVSRYYKGKYRYLVLESMYEEKNQTDPKEIERSKKERQLAYSDQVKYVNQSLIKKRNEVLEDTRSLIRRVRNHNGSVSVNEDRQNKTIELGGLSERNHLKKDGQHQRRDVETLDPYAEGLKNLQYVKSHIREKLMNGQEKKPKIQLIEIRENKDYLQELREQRQHKSLPHKQKRQRNDSTLRNSSLLNNKGKQSINDVSTANDVESLKARVDNLDERIKRKQVKNKHVKDHSVLDKQIERQYMESINAKLKLVQELK